MGGGKLGGWGYDGNGSWLLRKMVWYGRVGWGGVVRYMVVYNGKGGEGRHGERYQRKKVGVWLLIVWEE